MAYTIASVIAFAGVIFELSFYDASPFLTIFYCLVVVNIIFILIIHFKVEITKNFAKKILVVQLSVWFIAFSFTLFFMAQLKVLLLIFSLMAFIFSVRYLQFKISLFFVLLIAAAYYSISYIGLVYFDQIGDIRFESLVLISFIPVCIFVAYISDSENKQRKLLQVALKRVELITKEREAVMTRLAHVAATDELTGLLNRRSISESIYQELQRLKRNGNQFCILLIDVDHFKNINDTFGHQVGDKALAHLTKTMLQSIRNTDILARWGGEEFLLMLPDTSLNEAKVIAERLCRNVEKTPLTNEDAELSFTISGGLVQASGPTNTDELIHKADKLLYEAKDNGRNRINTERDTN